MRYQCVAEYYNDLLVLAFPTIVSQPLSCSSTRICFPSELIHILPSLVVIDTFITTPVGESIFLNSHGSELRVLRSSVWAVRSWIIICSRVIIISEDSVVGYKCLRTFMAGRPGIARSLPAAALGKWHSCTPETGAEPVSSSLDVTL